MFFTWTNENWFDCKGHVLILYNKKEKGGTPA